MTQFPDIFNSLAAPFDDVKQRQGGGGRMLKYITARQAMNRLDDVLGPERWTDEYYEVCDVLFCRLTITLPDGVKITKSGSGGFKQMMEKGQVDEENTDKTGESDAFKRAAVKFGVARYLYGDGVAHLDGNHAPAHAPSQARPAPTGNGHQAPRPGGNGNVPRSGRALFAWTKEQEEKLQIAILKPINAWSNMQGFPNRMVDWDAEQVTLAYAEICRRIDSDGNQGDAYEDALSN